MQLSHSRNHSRYPPYLPSDHSAKSHPYGPLGLLDVYQYNLRPTVNLFPWMSPVEDQRKFNDCTAEATAGALEYSLRRYHNITKDVSRLFIFWVCARLEHPRVGHMDDEAWLPEAIYGLVKYGFCFEGVGEHIEENFGVKPLTRAFDEAKTRTIVPIHIAPYLYCMKRCLNYDRPFLISFNLKLLHKHDMIIINQGRAKGPPLPIDHTTGKQQDQYHVVLVIGYDDQTQLFLVRNSWGKGWVCFYLD
ncbi:unnamed protein product [Didymodactylos carnosus]|uniref:Peptidase C1A papain C-terminal domain-containing protein n=1 Tax=Didymodactylos carnosus TaxID=1234261 RepID=A0A813XTZ4_9BILA|nr:unnamed protein product [Didymodactylos carnosus]CAF1071468.1 unnamed protein product [Didymodactylos carnosus]CAF3662344.1 unnamed protein product [Didymodactylos carnosus]CAF3835754.1 unnamed protein product [Didymodactylos carnosus]